MGSESLDYLFGIWWWNIHFFVNVNDCLRVLDYFESRQDF